MGTKERRQRELEDRRRAILEKSRDLFFERGYESVSVQDICDAVEYGRSSVYAFFSSKEEIYAHIYVEAMRILADMFQSVNPAASDFDREFIKCTQILFDFYKYHRNYFKALFYFSTNKLAYSKIPPAIRALKEAEIARAGMPVMALMRSGIDAGHLREFDVQEVVLLCWATVVGIIMSFIHKEMETEEETVERHCLRHAEIYLEGLKAK
ncbi:MAG: TetR/AcrR family transcriptional regulator [Desulfomonile tiedjei]|uniref:TetR/AcrR family transcriptional regulator n=1 Tax=Desulfomonile tiedjei TaxID=2358 RepID=A0A9D6V294_9BACT|nr:TetR/AcrR family transcriptional regulator [Desulfomonile tiedjei]